MLIEMLRRPEGATIAQIESQYVTLERRTGRSTSCPAEALCYGETVSKSLAAPEDFKRRLLKETEHVEC